MVRVPDWPLARRGLALCALHRRTGDGRTLAGAILLGEWIVSNCTSTGPLGGFTTGLDRDGVPMAQVSTARNAELVALFTQLAALTGDRAWLLHRAEAARFVASMWDPVRQMFNSGAVNGVTIDASPTLLEAQTHAWLALGNLDHIGCLDHIAGQLTVTDTASRPNSALTGDQSVTGVTVSTASRTADPNNPIEPGLPRPDPDAVWLEGTAQFALALHHSPIGALHTTAQLRTLTTAQVELGDNQTVADQPLPADAALVAATSPLHVGYIPSGYYPIAHVAATAWFLLAATGTNPLH